MSNEWMDQEAIYIVNLNHETKRNLEALEREVDRRLKKKSRRYVSRAEKQIVAFMVMAISCAVGLALVLCGYHLTGLAVLTVGMIALGVSVHYEP